MVWAGMITRGKRKRWQWEVERGKREMGWMVAKGERFLEYAPKGSMETKAALKHLTNCRSKAAQTAFD